MGLNPDADLRRLNLVMEALARRVGLVDFSVQFARVETVRSAVLLPEEDILAATYRSDRLATFRAGRLCAHRALAALGLSSVAILRDAGGAPIWPPGLAGSIAHTKDVAAAVVVRNAPAPAIGIDIEADNPLDDVEILDIVCRPDEAAVQDREDPSCLDKGKLSFVIKEAIYKSLWPIHRKYLDFKEVSLSFRENSDEFLGYVLSNSFPLSSESHRVRGRYARIEGHYMAIAYSETSPTHLGRFCSTEPGFDRA